MTGKSNLFDVASASMAHATKRHQIISNNIAHSDTPNYTGRDLKTFSLDDVSDYMRLKSTRPTHLNASEGSDPYAGLKDPIKQSAFDETINNNQISVEEEVAKAAEAIAQHNLAMGVWQKSKSIMMHIIDSRR
jgi:flagellar basal-body rod protein FlgB